MFTIFYSFLFSSPFNVIPTLHVARLLKIGCFAFSKITLHHFNYYLDCVIGMVKRIISRARAHTRSHLYMKLGIDMPAVRESCKNNKP